MSTGNLYYYYYPVAAYPLNEKADQSDELDPLVLVLLPVALLVGFLALISIFSEEHFIFYFYTSLTSAALRRLLGCENFKLPTPYLLFVISFSCNFRNVFIHDFDLSSLFASIQFPTKMPPL